MSGINDSRLITMPERPRSFRLDWKTVTPGDACVLGLMVFTFGPMIVVSIAGGIAWLWGEPLNAANAPDIPVIGGLLYACLTFSMIWSMIFARLGFLALLVAIPCWFVGKCIAQFGPQDAQNVTTKGRDE